MRHWKIILSLVAIFLAGFVTGGVMTLGITKRVIAKRQALHNWGTTPTQLYLKHYREELGLTPEQMKKLQPAFARLAAELRGARSNMVMEAMTSVRQLNEEVVRELTPEQQARFEKMKERNRAHLNDQFNAALPPAGRRPKSNQ